MAKKFLYSPFPVESCLEQRICENLNAEIASGTVRSGIDAVGYLMWTFYARRVRVNPSFYGAKSGKPEDVEDFLRTKSMEALKKLDEEGCVEVESVGQELGDVSATPLGKAASEFYLTYKTPKQMLFGLRQCGKMVLNDIERPKLPSTSAGPFSMDYQTNELTIAWLLYSLSCTHEFDELPVRHNEDVLNEELGDKLMWGVDTSALMNPDQGYNHRNREVYLDPHTK